MAVEIGSVISGFRIDAVLGQGGMSRVYRATQLDLQRRVALKVMAPELAADPQYRARFLREARTAAGVDHPNVLPVYQAGEADEQLWMAMRYVDGGDLRQLLERGIPDRERCIALLKQVAAGLDAAHRAGLVHRDVKPENVLLTSGSGSEPAGHVYLADFGLTKSVAGKSDITGKHEFVGTVAYAAPEQVENRALDHRVDIYALGCILYECFAGEPPFSTDSSLAALYAHLEREPPKLTAIRPDLPVAMNEVVARAMAKEPGARFPTATQLINAAEAALASLSRPAVAQAPTMSMPLPGAPTSPAPPQPVPAPPTPAPSPPRRRRGPVVALAVTVVAVAAAAAAVFAGRERSHTGTEVPSNTTTPTVTSTSLPPGQSEIGFQPQLLTKVPAGWTLQKNDNDMLALIPDGLPNSLLTFFRPTLTVDADATPRTAARAANLTSRLRTNPLDFLRTHPRLTTKSADPIIGMDTPAPGVEATVSSAYDCDIGRCVWLFGLAQTLFALLEPNNNAIYAVQSGQDTVLISLESPETELARFRATAFPLIRSIHFAR